MMLPTPNTSSSTISVINAIHISGCVSHSIKNSSKSNYQQSKANFIQESGSGVERSVASMSNSSQVKWIILVKNHQSTDGEFVTLVQTLEKKWKQSSKVFQHWKFWTRAATRPLKWKCHWQMAHGDARLCHQAHRPE